VSIHVTSSGFLLIDCGEIIPQSRGHGSSKEIQTQKLPVVISSQLGFGKAQRDGSPHQAMDPKFSFNKEYHGYGTFSRFRTY
jgi:hypothetical protein